MVKTLVFEKENTKPLIVLTHGDRRVLTVGAPDRLQEGLTLQAGSRHTCYLVGCTKKAMPVFIERARRAPCAMPTRFA